jgi:shikimate kinase
MPRIVLVGMMGSGKTTVGRILAERLGVPFKDSDKMLHSLLGRPVHELFRYYGEEAFRQHETRLLQGLPAEEGVLSTGGGIVLRDENWTELRRLGTTVFLDVELETLKARLATAKKIRPLIQTEEWRERVERILEERRPKYEQADLVLRLKDEDAATVAGLLYDRLSL